MAGVSRGDPARQGSWNSVGLRGRAGRRWRWALVPCALLLAAYAARAEEPCVDCHVDSAGVLADSVHGWADCIDCHPGADDPDHPDGLGATSCAGCHDEVAANLADSIHGGMADDEAAACATCHGEAHRMLSAGDPASPVCSEMLAQTCGSCHADPEMADRYRLRMVRPVEAFSLSVHATSSSRDAGTPCCADCHDSHSILPAADPRSLVHHRRVPETCGACHKEITAAYKQSVHGQAAAIGIRESPVCTDCHGEHRILSPSERGSPVFATNIPKMTCGRCHGDLHLSEKYGMSAEKVPAYADSFHGLASRSGRSSVAHCASCHGVHDILPSSDPRSHVSEERLAETCGQCHPGAGERFAIGPVHVVETDPEHAAVYWVRKVYLWLIVLVIGGMVLHNGLDLYRKVRNPPDRSPLGRPSHKRMGRAFRRTHAMLMTSFIVLVYTGFALKYPESWWAAPLLAWEDSLGLRGWIHRAAGVVMLLAGAIHFLHLISDRRARACILEMRPGREDLIELKERLEYFFGRRKTPPEASWLGYGEKAEYLAVIWGTMLMGVTGVMLWVEGLMLRWLPSWALDVATAVHFYEAILASLAILVWHFYAVIFDPAVYPMDPAWLSGRSAPARERERRPPHYAQAATQGPADGLGSPGA